MEKVALAYRTENFSPFVFVLQETGRSKYEIDIDPPAFGVIKYHMILPWRYWETKHEHLHMPL